MTPREILDARVEQLRGKPTAFERYCETPFYQENDVFVLPPQSSNVRQKLHRLALMQKEGPIRVVYFLPRLSSHKGLRKFSQAMENFLCVNAYAAIEWDLLEWLCSFRATRLRRFLAVTYGGPGPVNIGNIAQQFGLNHATLLGDFPALQSAGITQSRVGAGTEVVLTDSEYRVLWPESALQPVPAVPKSPRQVKPPHGRTASVLEACLKHELSLRATIDILKAAQCDELAAHIPNWDLY